jgi:hypothetical protein
MGSALLLKGRLVTMVAERRRLLLHHELDELVVWQAVSKGSSP